MNSATSRNEATLFGSSTNKNKSLCTKDQSRCIRVAIGSALLGDHFLDCIGNDEHTKQMTLLSMEFHKTPDIGNLNKLFTRFKISEAAQAGLMDVYSTALKIILSAQHEFATQSNFFQMGRMLDELSRISDTEAREIFKNIFGESLSRE